MFDLFCKAKHRPNASPIISEEQDNSANTEALVDPGQGGASADGSQRCPSSNNSGSGDTATSERSQVNTPCKRRWMPRPSGEEATFDIGGVSQDPPKQDQSDRQLVQTVTSDLSRRSYGFDAFLDPTKQSIISVQIDKQPAASATKAETEQKEQTDPDLVKPKVKLSDTVENQEIEGQGSASRTKSSDEIPEIENQRVDAKETGDSEDHKDSVEEGSEVDGSRDQGQEAVPGQESSEVVNEEADEQKAEEEGEEDVFQDLPMRAPYKDPPVFKGHHNYGFEFFPSWAQLEQDLPDDQDETLEGSEDY